jgi:hypothetical protein
MTGIVSLPQPATPLPPCQWYGREDGASRIVRETLRIELAFTVGNVRRLVANALEQVRRRLWRDRAIAGFEAVETAAET